MVTYPEDWKETTLGQLGEVKMCKRIFQSQTRPTGQIPFYKIGTFGNATSLVTYMRIIGLDSHFQTRATCCFQPQAPLGAL